MPDADIMTDRLTVMRMSLLKWFPFRAGKRALYVGNDTDASAVVLSEAGLQVDCVMRRDVRGIAEDAENRLFDYVVCVEKIEREEDPKTFLLALERMLADDGRLLLAMNNRLGLRYVCGDRDPYTGRNFDGLDNYRNAQAFPRCYSETEIREMLDHAGMMGVFYAALPDLRHTALLIKEGFTPNEDIGIRLTPVYWCHDTVFLEERRLYADVIREGLLHKLANSWLIVCGKKEGCFRAPDIDYVTSSMQREKSNAFLTIVHDGSKVEKVSVFSDGRKRLIQLSENTQYLKNRGISVIEGRLEEERYTMPYVNAPTGQRYLRELLYTDPEQFLLEMDHFWKLILQSSDIVREDPVRGPILGRAFYDMIPLNTIRKDDEFYFFDQEFVLEEWPAKALMTRAIVSFYASNGEFTRILPREELLRRYDLLDQFDDFYREDQEILAEITGKNELGIWLQGKTADINVILENRERINQSV